MARIGNKVLTAAEVSNLFAMTATRCLCCNAHLRDTESTERGLGPICSKKYYTVQHVVTEDMREEALGAIAAAERAGHIPSNVADACIKAHDAGDTRTFANVLVYFGAINNGDRAVVLSLLPPLRAIGYDAMADRLEEDRMTVRMIQTEDDAIWIAVPKNVPRRYNYDIRRVNGSRRGRGPTGYGNRVGHYVPVAGAAHAMAVLGYHIGGKPAWKKRLGETGQAVTIQPATYDELKAHLPKRKTYNYAAAPVAAPLVPVVTTVVPTAPGVRIEHVADKGFFRVYSPFNQAFLTALKADVAAATTYKDRRWNRDQQCWEVKAAHEALVMNLIITHYGQNPARA